MKNGEPGVKAMMQILLDCQLEWDQERGVLYVHDKTIGKTVLRICSLDKCARGLLRNGMIDIINIDPKLISYPDNS